MVVSNRKQIEKIVYDTFDALDPTGKNTNKYREMFGAMDDKAFASFMKNFLEDEHENFSFDITEYENDLKFEYCEKAADVLGIPLMEYVYMPHLTMDKSNVIVTKEKCLVGYFNVKRTQQFVSKKNGIAVSNEKRSTVTGQVTNKDKVARDADSESFPLVALGADAILQELHGPRADDMKMKQEMNQQIANKGYALLEDMTNLPTNKVTLTTVNTYLLGMGLKSDLISPTYILPKLSEELFGDE